MISSNPRTTDLGRSLSPAILQRLSRPGVTRRRRRRPTQEALAMEAREYIRCNAAAADKCSPAKVACALEVTSSHLCHAYRQAFGITVGAEIRRRRIDHACTLLADWDRSLKELAAQVGYARATYRTFLNAFCKETGMSPSDYRGSLELRGSGASGSADDAGRNDSDDTASAPIRQALTAA